MFNKSRIFSGINSDDTAGIVSVAGIADAISAAGITGVTGAAGITGATGAASSDSKTSAFISSDFLNFEKQDKTLVSPPTQIQSFNEGHKVIFKNSKQQNFLLKPTNAINLTLNLSQFDDQYSKFKPFASCQVSSINIKGLQNLIDEKKNPEFIIFKANFLNSDKYNTSGDTHILAICDVNGGVNNYSIREISRYCNNFSHATNSSVEIVMIAFDEDSNMIELPELKVTLILNIMRFYNKN
jgi:hypothetical protein